MATPRIPMLRPGQTPSAAAWNELVRLVNDTANVNSTAFGDLGVNSGGSTGTQIVDGRLKKHWAKITSRGTGNLYAHTAVAPKSDGTFELLPQNPDNPYGTATADGTPAREANGLTDFDDLLPIYVELWLDEPGLGWKFDKGGAGSGTTPSGSACQPHGWLTDRQALIDMATETPKRVLTYEVFDGATGGRCDCIHEQGRDSTTVPYPYTAFYDSVKGLWVGSVLINTCCGCARLEIDIIEEDGDTTDDHPPITATLYLIGDPCDASEVTQYPLKYQCATESPNVAEFSGGGPALCTGVKPFPCLNDFKLTVTCADCDMTQGKCDAACSESCAPPLYKIDTTGLFTGADAAYSGVWFLPYVGNCTWQIVCGTVTITLVLSHTGDYNGDSTIAVTFGGAATYHLTALGQHLSCFNNGVAITLNRDTGDPALTPATIDVVPIYCEPCAPFECQDFSHSLKVSASSDDIPCIDGWEHDLTWSNYTSDPACGGSQWISDNFDPPCTTDTGFGMVCCTIVANDQQVLGADWNGCALSLVDVTDSPLSITWSFTGTCGAYTGTIIFVVTEQP